jgi:hypothetical protein
LRLIDEIVWHGIEVNGIFLDRTNPGPKDTLVLSFLWPDDVPRKLVFSGCWQAKLNMNFGIIAKESIELFNVNKESEEVKDFRNFWKFEITNELYFADIH